MSKIIYLVVLLSIFGVVRVQSLECYVCNNCAKVTKSQLQTCSAPAGTTTTTTTRPVTVTPATTPGYNNTNSTGMFARDFYEQREFAGCDCTEGYCDCLDNRVARVADVLSRAVTFECFKYSRTVSGSTIIDRGCVEVNSTTNACAVLNINTGCTSCNKDKCNSALNLKFSISLIVLAIISTLTFV